MCAPDDGRPTFRRLTAVGGASAVVVVSVTAAFAPTPLGAILAGIELAVPVLIAFVCLCGSDRCSARAVRLLSLLMDKDPERYLPDDQRHGKGMIPVGRPSWERGEGERYPQS